MTIGQQLPGPATSWLPAAEAAEAVGVHPDVLVTWSGQGRLESRQGPDGPVYDRASVAELLLRMRNSRCPEDGQRLLLRADGTQWCTSCHAPRSAGSASI